MQGKRCPIGPAPAGAHEGLIVGLSAPRLARALVALHRTPGAPWALSRMAATAGMSRAAFAARFKEVTGFTPAQYLSRWRLTLACAALRRHRPAKAIAGGLGNASASSLSKAFKQRFGQSPREWLQDHGVDAG